MKDIELMAHYGDVVKNVRVTYDQWGTGCYQVLIDKFFHGSLCKTDNGWIAHLSPGSDITSVEIEILGEIIDNSFKAIQVALDNPIIPLA